MSGPLALLDAGNDDAPQVLPPFDDVYVAQSANVHRFCLSQLGDAEAAADVTQDAFIKAFSAYERVSPDPRDGTDLADQHRSQLLHRLSPSERPLAAASQSLGALSREPARCRGPSAPP